MRTPEHAVNEAGSVRIRLADEVYASWSAAQVECHEALEAWFRAGASDRAAAHCAYRAALDREGTAARDLEWLLNILAA
jgi:hypothetical protein